MSEMDLGFKQEIEREYRLLGFEGYDDGFKKLDEEVKGLVGESSDKISEYLEQRTADIDNERDRKLVKKLIVGRIRETFPDT